MKRKIAIIFDFDGTLIDTEMVHAEAEAKILNKLGIQITSKKITEKYAGIPTESYIEKLAMQKMPLSKLMRDKNRIVNNIVQNSCIGPISGMPDLVSYLNAHDVPIYIASSSSSKWLKTWLNLSFKLKNTVFSYGDYFNNKFISYTDVKNPKPSPHIFLKAKEGMKMKYNITNEGNFNWIVIGDSLADGYGATNAGMDAFIFGKFSKKSFENKKLTIFPTPARLIKHVKKLLE